MNVDRDAGVSKDRGERPVLETEYASVPLRGEGLGQQSKLPFQPSVPEIVGQQQYLQCIPPGRPIRAHNAGGPL